MAMDRCFAPSSTSGLSRAVFTLAALASTALSVPVQASEFAAVIPLSSLDISTGVRLDGVAGGSGHSNTCTRSDGVTGSMTNGRINLVDAARCTFTGRFTLGGAVNTIRHSILCGLVKSFAEAV